MRSEVHFSQAGATAAAAPPRPDPRRGRGTYERGRRRAARWQLKHRVLSLAAFVIPLLPLRLAGALGAALGAAFGAIAIPVRRTVARHLEMALGAETTAAERRRIALRYFRHSGRSIFEGLVYVRLGRRRALAAITEVVGEEHAAAALARGRGVIGVSLHLGLWELAAAWSMSWARGSGRVIGARMRPEPLDRMVRGMRRRLGVEMVHPKNVRELLRVLRAGGVVGVLVDQDSNKQAGVFLPFFGRPAFTLTGPATLAQRSGAAIVPVACVRTGPRSHRIWILPELEVDRSLPAEEWIVEMTRCISAAYETYIRAHPEQWQWVHRRWDTTPEVLERRRRRRARTQVRRMLARPGAGGAPGDPRRKDKDGR